MEEVIAHVEKVFTNELDSMFDKMESMMQDGHEGTLRMSDPFKYLIGKG